MVNLRAQLGRTECFFIIDFLIDLCKHAQANMNFAISLATHLLPEFDKKTNGYLEKTVLKEAKEQSNHELIYVNYELRAQVFFQAVKRREVTDGFSDELFMSAFNSMHQAISSQDPASVTAKQYMPQFFVSLLKMFVLSKDLLNAEQLKRIIDGFVHSGDLLVTVNSLPLYLLALTLLSEEPVDGLD